MLLHIYLLKGPTTRVDPVPTGLSHLHICNSPVIWTCPYLATTCIHYNTLLLRYCQFTTIEMKTIKVTIIIKTIES